jgi:hypothetical protein
LHCGIILYEIVSLSLTKTTLVIASQQSRRGNLISIFTIMHATRAIH